MNSTETMPAGDSLGTSLKRFLPAVLSIGQDHIGLEIKSKRNGPGRTAAVLPGGEARPFFLWQEERYGSRLPGAEGVRPGCASVAFPAGSCPVAPCSAGH